LEIEYTTVILAPPAIGVLPFAFLSFLLMLDVIEYIRFGYAPVAIDRKASFIGVWEGALIQELPNGVVTHGQHLRHISDCQEFAHVYLNFLMLSFV
jgi:hypothetical protein